MKRKQSQRLWIATLLLLFSCGSLFSQVTITVKNKTIKEIIPQIEKQSGYSVFYNSTMPDLNTKVDLSVSDASIETVLNNLFSNTDITYQIKTDKQVLLLSKQQTKANTSTVEHSRLITGIVTDKSGEPIIGASIKIKGTNIGNVTDIDGNFSLETSPQSILIISYISYLTREIRVSDKLHYNIELEEDNKILDEIVVVGYGTQKKGNLTAAISTINASEITTTTSSSLAQSIQGKIPGLQIRQQAGQPGEFNSSINIRGFGSPLYVIDGIVRDGGTEFQQLNPNDIENISVLKDASAAIYGLNAANGVILVTTKRGKAGRPQFSYNGVVGWITPTYVTEMANAAQYVEMRNDASIYGGNGTTSDFANIDKWRQGAPGFTNTNWYDETMKSNSMQQQHDFSVRGGNDAVNYFVSFGYVNEGGLLKSNDMDYNRYNLRSNLSAKLSNDLTADVMISGLYSKQDYPGGDGFMWIYKGTLMNRPTESPYLDGDKAYPADVHNGENTAMMSQKKYAGYSSVTHKNFQSSASLTYKAPFLEGLQGKATIAYDSKNMFNKKVWKNYNLYTPSKDKIIKGDPRILNASDDANRIVFQAQVNYNKTFADVHNVRVTAVYEQKTYNKKYAELQRKYDVYTNDVVDNAAGIQTNRGDEEEQANMSYIGRFNYDYAGKYLIEYAFRYDGSYRYAPGSRWAFFPSVSGGWRISEESFVKNNAPFIDNLKLRASYGTIGEDVGSPFQHVMGYVPKSKEGYEFEEGKYTGGFAAPGVINRNYTWIKSEITDIGIEGSIFKNLLSFEFDYYRRHKSGKVKTRDASSSLPNTFGGDMPVENLESERTEGFDFIINHQNKIQDFKYGVSFNMNIARTMHRTVDKPAARSSYDRWRNGLGNRWNDYEWAYDYIGQFQNYEQINQAPIHGTNVTQGNSKILPGDYIYADVNGDGIIDGKDLQPILRNRTPKLFYGFTLNGEWKNFDVNMLFQGASLYTVKFDEIFSQLFMFDGNVPAYFHDRWHQADPTNPDSEWISGKWPAARLQQDMQSSYRTSSIWRMKASFLRLKSLEVGYTLPSTLTKKYGMERVRFYTNAFNLLTFTSSELKNFDPEKYEGSTYKGGYDYPLTKSYNIGVNISF